MACPTCDKIRSFLRLEDTHMQEPIISREAFERFLPELLGFDTSQPEWHTPGRTRDQVREVLRTHRFAPSRVQPSIMAPEPRRSMKRTKSGNKRRKCMSKNLKLTNARARKKNGQLKKGWDQARIMKTAQRLTKRECK